MKRPVPVGTTSFDSMVRTCKNVNFATARDVWVVSSPEPKGQR